MIKVALYARVSTEEQVLHGYSIDAQKEALIKYAKEHDMEIVEIYVDEGLSARKKYSKRKEFMRLLSDIELNKFELILFTKLDRWFRNISDYYKIQELLERNNVNWKTIYENYDTTTASGRLHINIMLSVAQDEADRTSERIKVVFANKIKNKEVVTGKMPYGYKVVDKKVAIDEEKAMVVKDIFDYYQQYRSKNGTMTYINAKYNMKRSYDFFADILKTEMFTGTFRNMKDYCPAIISREQFMDVQDSKRSFVRKNQTCRVYIFSGLITCDECNHAMQGMQSITTANKFLAYRCRNAVSYHRCTHRYSIREDYIESYLLENIDRLHDEYVKAALLTKSKQKKVVIDRAGVKKKLKKLKELYINDLIDIDEYKKDYDKYNAMLAEIDEPEEDYSSIDEVTKILESDYLKLYNKLDRDNQRIFWRSIIKEIRIDQEHNITVVF